MRRLINDQGAAMKVAPDTRRGILAHWKNERAKFYCVECALMQEPVKVGAITQTKKCALYETVLECGHTRSVGCNVTVAQSRYDHPDPAPHLDPEAVPPDQPETFGFVPEDQRPAPVEDGLENGLDTDQETGLSLKP